MEPKPHGIFLSIRTKASRFATVVCLKQADFDESPDNSLIPLGFLVTYLAFSVERNFHFSEQESQRQSASDWLMASCFTFRLLPTTVIIT